MPGRRTAARLTTAAALSLVGVLLTGAAPCGPACVAAAVDAVPAYAEIELTSDGVVLDAAGLPHAVPAGSGVRDDPAQAAAQDAWLARGTIPGGSVHRDLATRALRDLDALVLPSGAALAGPEGAWRYVWPRDASFAAVALARTGHEEDAYAVLLHLQRLQTARSTGGVFEARYLPDGTGDVPDDRGLQLDGNGWVLWAVAEWYATQPRGRDRDAALEALRPVVVRSVAAVRAHVDPVTGLPAPSADYWEVPEDLPTLGTVAPLLLGARAIGPVLEALGEPPAADLAWLLERGVDHFAPAYPRRLGGSAQDAAVTLLMPPFAPLDEEVRVAWQGAAASMARPAGGLAPGGEWRADGVSWTPTTALFALTAAASGDEAQAEARLAWLTEHATARGSLPEKVLWDGRPSAVAPLAWTASLVLLTLDELGGAASA